MKKIISEIIKVVILYIICAIYLYYNSSEPNYKYSWLVSIIIVTIIYAIIMLASHKKKKNK